MWAVEKQYYEMPELVGFQTMVILDPNGMTFDAVGVFGLVFWLLFKSGSSYCDIWCWSKLLERNVLREILNLEVNLE